MEKKKIKKKKIKELVNPDFTRIEGSEVINKDHVAQTGQNYDGIPQTTDDAVVNQRQGASRYLYRRFVGENNTNKSILKEKMDKLIEDIISKQDLDNDIVKRMSDELVRKNGIPSLDIMNETNPIVVKKVNSLVDIISRNGVTPEEKAIIINHLLSVDMSNIPQSYKTELKKKL
jgi:polyhydroxyalkanoate synthesis regulator phasin